MRNTDDGNLHCRAETQDQFYQSDWASLPNKWKWKHNNIIIHVHVGNSNNYWYLPQKEQEECLEGGMLAPSTWERCHLKNE